LTVGSIKLSTPGDTATAAAATSSRKSELAMTVTLTADARVYRDELVGRWLDEFKRTVESPEAYGLL
jgi:pyruvate/2-oxoglutarate dehydrogenase complex dihydrolipoamide acyltransferase (E2) component